MVKHVNSKLAKHLNKAEEPTNEAPQQQQQQPQEDNRARRQQQQQEQTQPRPMARLLSEYVAAPVSSTMGNERALDLLEAFRGLLETKRKMNGVVTNLQLIAPNIPGGKFPCIACYHVQYGPSNDIELVTYAVMMIETDTVLKPEQSDGGAFALELPTTVDSYYQSNDNYNRTIQSQIKRDLGMGDNAELTMLSGGVGTLPKEVNINDNAIIDNVLTALASQAVSPIVVSSIQHVTGDHELANDVTVDIIREGNYTLESDIQFHPQVTDVTGLPVAADAQITTTAYGGSGYSADDVLTLHNVAIKFDLKYEEREDIVPVAMGRGDKVNLYHYIGTHVITGVQQQGLLTLDRMLMAVSTAIISQDSRVWMEMLRPQPNPKLVPLGDFAAAGWDLPEGYRPSEENPDVKVPYFSPIPVESAQYTKDNYAYLYQTIRENVFPDQACAIDIPEAFLGSRAIKELEKTGLSAVGTANTAEERDILDARADMIDAACYRVVSTLDQMTDNRFSKYFGDSLTILETETVMIPLGYWIDENNQKRDLREIDYLAVRAFSGRSNNEKFMRDWEATMVPQAGYEATQCAERIALMRQIVGEVYIKGYAHRYIINPNFLQAAAAATVDAGVSPSFNNLSQNSARRLERGAPSVLSNHLVDRTMVDTFARNSIRTRGDGSRNQRPRFSRRRRQI